MTPRDKKLWHVCLSSLERFYLPAFGVLARSIAWQGSGWTRSGPSAGNTAGVAMALYRLRALGHDVPFDPDRLIDIVVAEYAPNAECEDIAVMLWADAVGEGRYVEQLQTLLVRALEAEDQTLALAWSLSALCHSARHGDRKPRADDVIQRLSRRIVTRQSPRTGLFYASGRRQGWLSRRNTVASLSSQTYTIYALVLCGAASSDPQLLAAAQRCGDALCALQGPEGQWWWRYDVDSAAITQRYPVYGVNQDAAIPLCLESLQLAVGDERYAGHIERGLDWLFGSNELRQPLVDEERGVIWRGIEQSDGGFRVIPEMYSYHPARCLYALSLKSDASQSMSMAI